jgi:uncharacterized protein
MRTTSTIRAVTGFLVGVAGGSVVVALAMPRSPSASLISAVLPLAVLVVLSTVMGRSVWTGIGLRRAGLRFWPAALLVPLAVAVFGYGTAAAFGLTDRASGPWSAALVPALTGSMLGVLSVLPEELGWRGFLLPRVQRLTSMRMGAVLTGLGDATVHLPLVIWTATYLPHGSRWIVAPLMLVTITSAGVFYAWLRNTSDSIWPSALAHGFGNALLGVLLASGSSEARLALIVGEGGVAIAIGSTVVAVTCLVGSKGWRRHRPARTGAEPTQPVYSVKTYGFD